jgi:hypothetical protein
MRYFFFIFIITVLACKQNKNDGGVRGVGYQKNALLATFSPAFIESCDLAVSHDSLRIAIFTKANDSTRILHREAIKIDSMTMDSLNSMFKTFRFTIAKSNDRYTDTTRFGLYEGDSVEYEFQNTIADGVRVRGTLTQYSKRRHFMFHSPDKGSDKHALASKLIYLMDRKLQSPESQFYLEKLKFFFDLPTTFDPWAKP